MRIDESKIINSAKITIDDIMTSIKDPDMDGWTEFWAFDKSCGFNRFAEL